MYRSQQNRQKGAVALFVVIFSTLLLSTITVSYVQLMLKDQRQSTEADLSRSAYDSAEAGVEDAKRLLLLNQACQSGQAASSVNCADVALALQPEPGSSQTDCNALETGHITVPTTDANGNKETIVQQHASEDSRLNQAYTCVKIAVNTDDYLGDLVADQSMVIPLNATAAFDTIELSWFSSRDLPSGTTSSTVEFPSSGIDDRLPPTGADWSFATPALMRAQFIQTGSSFTLSNFDDEAGGNRSNTNTLFLYPAAVGASTKSFAVDTRQQPTGSPQLVKCEASLAAGGYACSVRLRLQQPVNGSSSNRHAYLHLKALYNQSSFRIRLLDSGGNVVQFAGVQPTVDSTGRANDLFRRIKARVELRGQADYPDAALSVRGNFCKDFAVSSEASSYSATCRP